MEKTVRIRKLTPRECGRLMGFDDEDIDRQLRREIRAVKDGQVLVM